MHVEPTSEAAPAAPISQPAEPTPTQAQPQGATGSPSEAAAPEVPKDLQVQVATARAFAECHKLLARGHFRASDLIALDSALSFVAGIHQEALSRALAHPQADLVPELKAMKEAKNGQKA